MWLPERGAAEMVRHSNREGKSASKSRSPRSRRPGDSATRIYEGLRARILSMSLAPSAQIDEAALVREFQVSRTPIREAVVRLASEGLLTLLPNRGSQVAPLDLVRIRDYLEAMDLVQRAVTALAAKRRSEADVEQIRAACELFEAAANCGDSEAMVECNREFHLVIARACSNELLITTNSRLLDEGLRISRFTLTDRAYSSHEGYERFVQTVLAEHRLMLGAITARDAEAAERVARSHIDVTRARFSDFLSEGRSLDGSVLDSRPLGLETQVLPG